MATSVSSGSSTSESTSTPTYLETPENALIDALSNVAAGLANQMYSWAQGVFAQTSQITDAAVNNFFQTSQKMSGFAQGLTDQYNNLFAPENAQLVADANSYASPERMAANMGMAGATQAQAGEAALRNHERDLLSYGIDPSSGRYAALDEAAQVQNAANVAGAENLQRNSDIATGQRLRSEAVQVGSQLPSAVTNASNTAIQANTAASNASLANANTGKNLYGLPNDYLRTAMDIKLPPTGQNTQSKSQSQQNGSSNSPDRNNDNNRNSGGQQPGGGGSGGGSGGGGPAWMPQHGGSGGGGSFSGSRNVNPGSRIMSMGGGTEGQPDSGQYNFDGTMPDFNYLNDPGYFSGTGYGSVGDQAFDSFDYGGSNPFSDSGFGQEYGEGGPYQQFGGNDYSQFNDVQGWGNSSNIGYDPAANAVDPGWGQTYDQTPAPWPVDAPSGGSDGGYNNYNGGADAFGANYGSGNSYTDDSSNYSWSDGDYYAAGGEVKPQAPRPSPRMVPRQASPSGGRRTDDVRANLNAGEFVIPEDVARWKGAEFFHNMIAKSRKQRVSSPVGGKPMPSGDPRAQQRPTFSTR